MTQSSSQRAHGRPLAQQTCWNVAAATDGNPHPSPACSANAPPRYLRDIAAQPRPTASRPGRHPGKNNRAVRLYA